MTGVEISKEKIIVILGEKEINGSYNVLMYNKGDISEINIIRSNYEIDKFLKLKLEEKTRIKIEFADMWYISSHRVENNSLILDLAIYQDKYQQILKDKQKSLK